MKPYANLIGGQWMRSVDTFKNIHPSHTDDVGGRIASSYGPREQGRYAAEFHTTVKTSYVRP